MLTTALVHEQVGLTQSEFQVNDPNVGHVLDEEGAKVLVLALHELLNGSAIGVMKLMTN
jgi:hypothetical protein